MTALKQFLKKIECNKRMQIVFFCVSMTVLFALFIPSILFLREKNNRKVLINKAIVVDHTTLNNVKVNKKQNTIELSGWILRLNSKNKEVKIIFKAVNDSENVIIPTKLEQKIEIGDYFNSNYDFGNCAFFASVNETELRKDVCYELLFGYTYEENTIENSKKISSGKYLYNNELYCYNPTSFISPSFTDEWMNTVVLDGKLCFFDAEAGCWAYCYEDNLYFIVNDKFGVTEDRSHRMKFHIHTAQKELLPEDRQQYGFESKDFYFDEKEYVLSEESAYRVAVLNLSEAYEISYIEMGLYESGGPMLKSMSFFIHDWENLMD